MPHADLDLLNAAPAGFLSFRDDGTIIAVNDTLLDLLGYSRDQILGLHVERLFGVAARIFYQTHLFPLVRMHGRAEEIYLALRSSDDESVPILLNARRTQLHDQPVTHCVLIRVQERKKYEDELLRAKKAAEAAHAEAIQATEAKSHYLRSVSHEIRTPINAVLGYADLLELNLGQPMGEEQLGYVDRVRQAARHLLTLVNDILDLAKIESGAMTVDLAPASLSDAAEAALALVQPQARQQEVRLVHPDSPDPGRYTGDHERVIQILVNLLSNGIKFTDSGGRVELDWSTVSAPETGPGTAAVGEASPGHAACPKGPGPWLRVRVSDTGIGIPADRLGDLFQPFSQIKDPARDSRSGTGLGLTIAREFARLMGGDITVRSTRGEGSTFTLWLPARG